MSHKILTLDKIEIYELFRSLINSFQCLKNFVEEDDNLEGFNSEVM